MESPPEPATMVADAPAEAPKDSVAAGAAPPESKPSPEFLAVLGSLEDFEGIETVAVYQEMKKSARKEAPPAMEERSAPAPEAAFDSADGAAAVAESDEATEIGNALPETDAFMVQRAPKRIAMMATSVAIEQTALGRLANSETKIIDCFRDGYDPASFLSLRVFVGAGGAVTRTETFSANKMPLGDRTCVSEVIEKTVFSGAGAGGSFTLFIRPLGK